MFVGNEIDWISTDSIAEVMKITYVKNSWTIDVNCGL